MGFKGDIGDIVGSGGNVITGGGSGGGVKLGRVGEWNESVLLL